MKKCRIYVGRNMKEIERVLTALFSKGFVFTTARRLRNFKEVKEIWWCEVRTWKYIVTGCNKECKAVIGTRDYEDDDYEDITLEQFLKLYT